MGWEKFPKKLGIDSVLNTLSEYMSRENSVYVLWNQFISDGDEFLLLATEVWLNFIEMCEFVVRDPVIQIKA